MWLINPSFHPFDLRLPGSDRRSQRVISGWAMPPADIRFSVGVEEALASGAWYFRGGYLRRIRHEALALAKRLPQSIGFALSDFLSPELHERRGSDGRLRLQPLFDASTWCGGALAAAGRFLLGSAHPFYAAGLKRRHLERVEVFSRGSDSDRIKAWAFDCVCDVLRDLSLLPRLPGGYPTSMGFEFALRDGRALPTWEAGALVSAEVPNVWVVHPAQFAGDVRCLLQVWPNYRLSLLNAAGLFPVHVPRKRDRVLRPKSPNRRSFHAAAQADDKEGSVSGREASARGERTGARGSGAHSEIDGGASSA